MYSLAKKINALCIIFATANGIGTFLFLLYILGLELPFNVLFTVILYLVTSLITIITICVNVRGLCQDLQLDSDSTANRITRLAQRVKVLEELKK